MSLLDRAITLSLPAMPRFVVHRVARRYVAGDTLGDAIRVARDLNDIGAVCTLDLLGEELSETEACRSVGREYVRILEEIHRSEARTGVSLKLSSLGLRRDPRLTLELLESILDAAKRVGRFVRIDMEDSSTTTATLDTYRAARRNGHENVGVVLQSCLHRTFDDAVSLSEDGADVRVVKGIYREPESISWRHPEIIRRNFVRIVEHLMASGCRVASATHDEILVYETLALMDRLKTPREQIEFQMLLGVRENLRDMLLAQDRRVRIYVPYGERWYAYCMRRLRENPAVAGYVAKAFLGRIFKRS